MSDRIPIFLLKLIVIECYKRPERLFYPIFILYRENQKSSTNLTSIYCIDTIPSLFYVPEISYLF